MNPQDLRTPPEGSGAPDPMLALEAERRQLEARAQDHMSNDERAERCASADEVAERMAATPAATVAGVAMKVRAASVYVDFLPNLKGKVREDTGP